MKLLICRRAPDLVFSRSHQSSDWIPRTNRLFVFGTLLISLCCLQLSAQNVVLTGAVSGRVTDASGAVVPGASLLLQNLDTCVRQSTATNGNGLYRFLALTPGTYSVTASFKGFRDREALVRVEVGNTTLEDVKFEAGTSGDTIRVLANAPLLRPAESSMSTVLERPLIEELPRNGRRYTGFTTVTPNTSYDGDTGLVSIAGQQGGEDSGYANGNGTNAFTVDGTNVTNNYFADILGRYRIPYLYGEEAIQEFQVSVSPYSALYGGGAGFVNAVTRSGSNQAHGAVFYYNRNSATGAIDAIDKAAGFPKPDDVLHQFGFGLGGPIVRSRLWFHVDYEQQIRNNPIPVINQALTANSANRASFLSNNFGIPAGTTLPPPNGPLPVPGTDTAADVLTHPTNPVYLQQVSNVLNALSSNLGTKARERNDLVITPRLDYQATGRDSLFVSLACRSGTSICAQRGANAIRLQTLWRDRI